MTSTLLCHQQYIIFILFLESWKKIAQVLKDLNNIQIIPRIAFGKLLITKVIHYQRASIKTVLIDWETDWEKKE